ncbi:MAG: hypothetical protein KJO32_06615 [Deltaproteobacteria bacterium]|nr:hypothetical protein [Deltaproteobacteria bacterium]
MSLLIPVSWGEMLDKLTILEIKQERIKDKKKRHNISVELQQLMAIYQQSGVFASKLTTLIDELRLVNETLWDIEDKIRACEKTGDFSSQFIELARSVYITNDRRADLKYQINRLLDSDIIEEKSYESY